ncbi:MAG: exo-alpha-sialidase [Acidimicrobiia bacterium]|nr:exo-alpha-sialidase [Acidimicrobiia bacterium]MYJ14352.1 exo-alpha-sialidase [Acidimicrobiia bacterium]
MTDERQHDDRPSAGHEALGSALGEAVGRSADNPISSPPVADIAARAAARAKARRVRHGAVGIAAAAALIAGLATWNTLDGDGGDGSIQVATQPTMPEPAAERAGSQAEPTSGQAEQTAPEQAEQAAEETGAPAAGDEPAAAPATEPAEDESAPPPAGPTPTARDDSAEADTNAEATEAVLSSSASAASLLPSPAAISTGPALAWTEASIDLGAEATSAVELSSLGDGRIVASIRGPDGDRLSLTGDGVTWSSVELPDVAFPHRFAVAGDRWVIASNDWDHPIYPPTAIASRVFVSDDGGGTWGELGLDIAPTQELPPHCAERSAVQEVLAAGERVVVLVSLHRFLEIQEILTERGLIEAGTLAHEWRRSEDTLTIRLGDPADWDLSNEEQLLRVDLSELDLTPEQLEHCDGYASGRVVVLAGDGSTVSRVAEHAGGVTSAVATEDGFAFVVVDDSQTRRFTSSDGLRWVEVATGESGYGTVARGHDGVVWQSHDRNGALSISRGAVDSAPRPVAAFDVLGPLGVLSAGPAGVATAAWALPEQIRSLIGSATFTKDGYELRLGADGLSLWDIADGVAVYELSAEQMEADEPPAGVREVEEADGTTSVAFDDPVTGEELVRFTEADLIPDTDRLVDTREELFGPTGVPPIWIGWSANGERWGWQDAAQAFGLGDGEGLTPVSLAVGSDFVLARSISFDIAEAMALAESPEPEGSQSGPPSSWRARWFIAKVP